MEKKVSMCNIKSLVLVLIFTFAILLSINSVASAAALTEHYQEVNDQVSYIQTNNSIPGKGNFFIRESCGGPLDGGGASPG